MQTSDHRRLHAQAYGARNYGALGIVLQQAVVISTAVFALILALWTQVHHLLLLAGVCTTPAELPTIVSRSMACTVVPCCVAGACTSWYWQQHCLLV